MADHEMMTGFLAGKADDNNRRGDMWGGDGWWAIILFAMIFGWGRGGFGGHEEEMERELRRAYEEGFEEGRREGRGGYGERGSYGQGGGYGERGEYDRGGYEYDDAYGERRGVRGTGPYSRYRRR